MIKYTLFIFLFFIKSFAGAYPIDLPDEESILDRYTTSHTELYLDGEVHCNSGNCFRFSEGEPENLLEKHSRMIFDDENSFNGDAVK